MESSRIAVPKSRIRLTSIAVGALLPLLLVAPTPSLAGGAHLFRISGAVTRAATPQAATLAARTHLASIVSPVYYEVRGQATDDGWAIAFDLEATGGVAVVAQQVAFDPRTGRMTFAVGRPNDTSLAALTRLQADRSASSVADVGSSGGAPTADNATAVAPLLTTTWTSTHGFFSTFWTDPIGITVNSVIDEAHWQYNRSTVRSLTGNDLRQWFTGNGWSEVSHSIGAYYNSNSTVGTVYTNDRFRTTSWFPCPGASAHNTYYQANNVYGFADGHTGGGVNTWATGTCAFLLEVTAFASPGA